MTQQPFYPPQQGYPPQQAPQQPYAPQQYQQPAPAAYQQPYAPQGYGQPAPGPQQPPLAQGGLDEFYSQRATGSGPGLSWQNKPIGHWYAGVVSRDVGDGDVQQQTNTMQQPQFFKDGSPKFQMLVPLGQVQAADGQAPENGEGTWYVKGQARDELSRAMQEAGCSYRTPKAGDFVVVTLVQRRPSGAGFQPANVFQIRYQPANATAGGQVAGAPAQQATGAPSPAPEAPQQQQVPQQPPAPPMGAPVQPQQQYQQQPAPPMQQQIPQPPPGTQGQPPMQQQAPIQPPQGLDPQAASILSQLTSGQPQQVG